MKARSADGRHRGYEYNKQSGYALEALCLRAVVGVVGETFADARNEFPAPPRPNETWNAKEGQSDPAIYTKKGIGRKTKPTYRASWGWWSLGFVLGRRGREGQFEFGKVKAFPGATSRLFGFRFLSAGGCALGGGYKGIGALYHGRCVHP